jgi:hypothetical protein
MDKPFQGLQLMITNNMRKTLIEELQYEPEEVDDMEPQVRFRKYLILESIQ